MSFPPDFTVNGGSNTSKDKNRPYDAYHSTVFLLKGGFFNCFFKANCYDLFLSENYNILMQVGRL